MSISAGLALPLAEIVRELEVNIIYFLTSITRARLSENTENTGTSCEGEVHFRFKLLNSL